MSRRSLLKLGLSSLPFLLGAPGRVSASASAPKRPRYFMLVFVAGGIDAVYTTDPKSRADVVDWVDVPYASSAIATRGDLQLGPHFAPLLPWADRMAIVNGVQVRTANHHTGNLQLIRLKLGIANQQVPSFTDILALHRQGQPLGTATLGPVEPRDYSAGFISNPDYHDAAEYGPQNTFFDELERLVPDDLARMANALRKNAATLGGRSPEVRVTVDNMRAAAALYERLIHIPKLGAVPPGANALARSQLRDVDRSLWTLENDLAASVVLRLGIRDWDTHHMNATRQTRLNATLVRALDQLLQGLASKRNEHGNLLDNTAVVVSSEIGRMPQVNEALGKDHFPEVPMMFFGAPFNTGKAYGRTSTRMESLPISLETGMPKTGGHMMAFDDVGTTLLRVFGIEPSRYGYFGKTMPFLAHV